MKLGSPLLITGLWPHMLPPEMVYRQVNASSLNSDTHLQNPGGPRARATGTGWTVISSGTGIVASANSVAQTQMQLF